MSRYVLAIDQGTTGTTALLIDRKLGVKARVNREFPQHFPRPGWVEHDLEDIWRSVRATVAAALRPASLPGRTGRPLPHPTIAPWRRAGVPPWAPRPGPAAAAPPGSARPAP